MRGTGGILQPTTNLVLQPAKSSTTQHQVGSTWSNSGNLNIDLECLSLSGKGKPRDSAPSMNQLANPMSPTAHVTFSSGMNMLGARSGMMVASPSSPMQQYPAPSAAQFASFK